GRAHGDDGAAAGQPCAARPEDRRPERPGAADVRASRNLPQPRRHVGGLRLSLFRQLAGLRRSADGRAIPEIDRHRRGRPWSIGVGAMSRSTTLPGLAAGTVLALTLGAGSGVADVPSVLMAQGGGSPPGYN